MPKNGDPSVDAAEQSCDLVPRVLVERVLAPELARPRCRPSVLLLVLPLLLSCGSQKMSDNQKVSGRAQLPVSANANKEGAAQLAGDWRLSLWLPSHGIVVAILHLEASGHGQYVVTATGLRRSGDLRVTAWDGEWLEGKAVGVRKRLRATMEGNMLYVELPVVGRVKLIRKNSQGGAVHFSGS